MTEPRARSTEDALREALEYAAGFMADPEGLAHRREEWLAIVNAALSARPDDWWDTSPDGRPMPNWLVPDPEYVIGVVASALRERHVDRAAEEWVLSELRSALTPGAE